MKDTYSIEKELSLKSEEELLKEVDHQVRELNGFVKHLDGPFDINHQHLPLKKIDVELVRLRLAIASRNLKLQYNKETSYAKKVTEFNAKLWTLKEIKLKLISDDRNEEYELKVDKGHIEKLLELHIEEWRHRYDLNAKGLVLFNGLRWQLYFILENGYLRYQGFNLFPHNFNDLLEIMGVEKIY